MRLIKYVVAVAALGSLWLVAPASALNFIQPAGSPYATGELESNSVLTGDLNGDGRDDLVTANADYSYSVFLANANGSLTQTPGSPFSTGPTYALSGTLVDFTDDGNLDLAIAANNQVIVRPGNGTGGFGAALPVITTTVNGEDITSGLVNDDDLPDLVVAGWSTDRVAVLYGDGSGGTLGSSTVATATGPVSVVTSDFDGDGLGDVATANLGGQLGQATTVLMNAGGGFFDRDDYDGTFQPHDVEAGDFNDDGDPDLIQVARSDSAIQLLYGDGNGEFSPGSSRPDSSSNWVNSAATADFDGDGFDDAVIGMSTNFIDPIVQSAPVFLGNSGTTLVESPDGPWAATTPAYPWTVATGDFNDDGHPDWVSGDQGGRISVFLNEVPALSVSPSSFNFPDRVVGVSSGPESFAFTNSGVGSLTIPAGGVSVIGANPGDFTNDADTCEGITLNMGDVCYVDIVFTPGAVGGRSASLRVSPAGGITPASAALTGTGLADPGISITPADHDFGTVGVFSSGTPQVFTIASTGTTPLDIASVGLTGLNANQFAVDANDCPASLQPEEDCEITVNYVPNVPGSAIANLTLATNAPNSPQTAVLRGSAQFPAISIEPNPVDFGPVPINDGPSAPMTATIGTSGVDLEIEGVTIYTNDFADFTITSDDCTGTTIEPGQTCEVEIEFEPGALGERDAYLRINHLSGVAISPVEGEGVANPSWSLGPGAHDFGTRLTDEGPGTPQVFTLTSIGTTDLETGTVSLAGTAPDQFQITAENCSNRTLAPEATCEVSIAFAPTTAGEKVADLHITTNVGGGPANAQVTGSGQDPVPPPDPCEPVAIKKVAYYTPSVIKRSNTPGVRARITTAGPADVRISSKVIYHLNGKQRSIIYGQRAFRVTTDSLNYKVAIPKKLRKQLRPKKQVRFVITYASKSTNPECTKFGAKKTRNLTTRVVWVIPNGG